MTQPLQCCAGDHIPGEGACARNSREMVIAYPSPQMISGDVPWQVYMLCGIYHRGETLAGMIRQADPEATVLVFQAFEGPGQLACQLEPGHYVAMPRGGGGVPG